ncbi:response regulator [Paenibacillus sp. PL91]|uniref:response regulator transcription factor n=1 Tax=Paenibacillus sp. PL91 TaxID=2729538 RepID=UPI00145EF850|nr:response regulator [Paenibacillus sp. PL91]MBC9202523.1 response regulator [Paenibacillus sp. PL91]
MFQLLIVDDEWFAVEGIKSGVDWSGLGFTAIYEAFNVDQAKARLAQSEVDVILCDIEMPGQNGIELAGWVREHFPALPIIFLTCHADFAYAQQAIHLGSFDYLLKPVDFDVLKNTVHKALEQQLEVKRDKQQNEIYMKYYKMWETNKTVLYERFWQDLMWQRIVPLPSHIERALAANDIPIKSDYRVLPILISLEKWEKPFSARDEDVMEYALRKTAEELLLLSEPGQVIRDGNGVLFALLFDDGTKGRTLSFDQMKKRCQAYIEACSTYLYCKVSCYIGEWSFLAAMSQSYNALLQMELNNVAVSQAVLFYKEQTPSAKEVQLPAFFEWAELLEQAKCEQLQNVASDMFDKLGTDAGIKGETLTIIYHGLLQTVYYVLQKRGVPAHAVLGSGTTLDMATATRSLAQLRAWTMKLIETVCDHLSSREKESTIVEKVKRLIENHLFDEMSRESLAASVHINPAYLSRLFRKESGMSLSDYMIQQKMKKVNELLLNSNETVSNIAKMFHYTNFSHFSKLYRKYYGLNPQEYRKQFSKNV